MANIIVPSGWNRPESEVTSESFYINRRHFLKQMGFLGVSSLAGINACGRRQPTQFGPTCSTEEGPGTDYPAINFSTENQGIGVTTENQRALSSYKAALTFNNFYEFSTDKSQVWCLAQNFSTSPWTIEVAGETNRPGTINLEDIQKIKPMEERIYRFRCVEAWAMTVPWIGYPLKDFIAYCQPKSTATHVKFYSAFHPNEMPGLGGQYSFPYYEGLRLKEAQNELALLTFGLYGKILANQNGAPLRVITPWKYGFKSIKSINKIEFVKSEPATFWNDLYPSRYTFLSNVDPADQRVPWSQAKENLIQYASGEGTNRRGNLVDTLKYNGYGKWVALLYA